MDLASLVTGAVLAAVLAGIGAWSASRKRRAAPPAPPQPVEAPNGATADGRELILHRRTEGFDVSVVSEGKDLCIQLDSLGRIDPRLVIRRETALDGLSELAGTGDVTTGDPSFDDRFLVHGPTPEAMAALGHEARSALLRLSNPGGVARAAAAAALRVEDGSLYCTLPLSLRLSRHRLETLLKELTRLASLLAREGATVAAAIARNASSDPVTTVRLRSLQVFMHDQYIDGELPRVARKALGDRDPSVRLLAAKLAGKTDKAFAALFAILRNRGARASHRVEALQTLVGTFPSRAALFLPAALHSGPAEVRSAALDAVGLAPGEALLPRVRELARDPLAPPVVACGAARALVALADPDAEALLVPLLARDSATVRAAAAQALGDVGTVRSVESLLPLTAEGREVRAAARAAIERIQARLGDAEAGRVSLTPSEQASGQVSLAEGGGAAIAPGPATVKRR